MLEGYDGRDLISSAEQGLLTLMVVLIMFGMGATLRIENFRMALRRPRAVLVGFASQFGVMPFCAFFLANLLNLEPAYAIGLIIIGCLPAGTTSNMFAYFSRGDVALSISMTTASTCASMVMMPLLLALYGSSFVAEMRASSPGEDFAIPYIKIVATLVGVLVPIGLGMLLLRHSPGWAKAAEDWASFLGLFVIFFLLVSMLVRHGDLLLSTGPELYLASVGVGLLGIVFGYGAARALRLPARHARTISLETGIQNGPLAFAIIILSFGGSLQTPILWMALVYSFFIVVTASLVTLFYRRIGKADAEAHENALVERELFGPGYSSE